MKKLFLKFKNSPFAINVSVLATGTVIAQTVGFLISPILSRLYSPGDYGLFAVFVSLVSVLLVICSFRFEMAIVRPKENGEAKQILKLSLVICYLFSLLTLVLIFSFNSEIASLLGNDNLSDWLYFIPPVLVAAGTVQIFNYWFTRNKKFKVISSIRVAQSLLLSGFSVLFGFLKFTVFGLILSYIISQVAPFSYFINKYFSRAGELFSGRFKEFAVKHKDFPAFNLPAALMDTISLNSIVLLLNFFFSESVTGSYSFALRILSIPGIILGVSVSQVFYQKISEAYNNNESLTHLIYRLWKGLFVISIVPTITVILWGPEIFAFVFGNDWIQAGEISRYIGLMAFFTFISSPTSSVLIVIGKQKIGFLFSIIVLIYRPAAILYGYFTNNFLLGIQLYVGLETLQIILFNIIMLLKLREADTDRK